MTVQELIVFVNRGKFYSLWEVNDEIENVFGTPIIVADGLNFDEYRWHSITTTVYKCDDGYVGVRGCSQLKSERIDWKDVHEIARAEEYEPVQTITYKPKNR